MPHRSIRSVVTIGLAAILATGCARTNSGDDDATSTTDTTSSTGPTESSQMPEPTVTSVPTTTATTLTSVSPTSAPTPTPSTTMATAGQTERFVPERPELTSCYGNLQCGAVVVPIDSDDLLLGTARIQIVVAPARVPSERIGILMVNPGGPGASGIEYAAALASGGASPALLDRFDIVGFDPRGVGDSDPEFACGTDQEWIDREILLDGIVDTEEEQAEGREAVESCIDSMGPLATRLGTEFVVSDMDVIREALGEEQINYYGASYGSTIGMWYASRFPDRARSIVVDGADNPVDDLSSDQAAVDSAVEEIIDLEIALTDALNACDNPSCPIYNNGDPVGFYLDTVDQLYLVDNEFNGKPTAGSLGVVTPLYNEGAWPTLWNGLYELSNGDPSTLAGMAEWQLQGEEGPSITSHINCLDEWASHPDITEEDYLRRSPLIDAQIREDLPLISALPWMDVPDFCAFFGAELPAPDGGLTGSGVPVVVVANRSDPVTPFTESIELAEEQLDNGYVVEVSHPSHVAYGQNQCVTTTVDEVLISGTPPAERRTRC